MSDSESEEFYVLHNGQSFSNSPSTPTPKSSLLSKTSSLISAVTSSTLSATLNTTGSLLKTAGTATTNYVIAPTATVVARDVLPEIIRLVYQYVKGVTPQRGRDIAKIFGGGAHALGAVLSTTPTQRDPGETLIDSSLASFDSLVDVMSSPMGRQLVIDSGAWFLKRAEAAATPEAEVASDAFVVMVCRVVDVLASSSAKEFYHNINDSMWDFVQVMADPSTHVATADVVANICHALAMEAEVYRKERRAAQGPSKSASCRRRRARHAKMRSGRGVVDGQRLEEAIVNAMGDGTLPEKDDGEEEDSPSAPATPPPNNAAQVGDVFTTAPSPSCTPARASNEIASAPPPSLPMGESDTTTTSYDSYIPPPSSTKKSKTSNNIDINNPPPIDINSVDYRLNERKKKLKEQARKYRQKSGKGFSFLSLLDKKMQENEEDSLKEKTGKSFYNLAAAAAGAGNERGQDNLRGESEIGVGAAAATERTASELALERYAAYVGLLVLGVVGLGVIWGLLGAYGLYVALFGGGGGWGGGGGGGAGVTVIYKFVTESESIAAAAAIAAAAGGEL